MALLTVEQAAERLGVTPRFIRRLTSEKRIPYVKLGGGSHVRIDEEDLDAFVAAGRIEAMPRQMPLAYPQIDCARDKSGVTRPKV
jgi:excisionase family DNA binding protein